jgi:hypothetical protein
MNINHPSRVDVYEALLALEKAEWERERAAWDAYERQQAQFAMDGKREILWRALFLIGVACVIGGALWASFG